MAVLVDNLRATGKDGKIAEHAAAPRSSSTDITGWSRTRSASTRSAATASAINQGFQVAPAVEAPEIDKIPIWESPPMLRDIAKLLAGLVIVVLLLLFVVKPLIRNITSNSSTIIRP